MIVKTNPKLLKNPVQIGVIGIRDPEDRYKIVKNIPLYAEDTPEIREGTEKMLDDGAKVFAEMFKKYADGVRALEREGK